MTTALTWGSVDLMPTDSAAAALGYMIEASADGTNWGNPEAVITAVQSHLQDGSLAVIDSFQNREAPVHIRVTSPTYQGLANAEAALVAESRRTGYNTLVWTPSVEFAVPSVFDVDYGILTFAFDDLGEVNLERQYVATLSCLPFPRSATEVVATAVAAPPGGAPAEVSIDNASSVSDWLLATSPAGGVISAPGTYIRGTSNGDSSVQTLTLKVVKSGGISLTGYPYVYIDWRWSYDNGLREVFGVTAQIDGTGPQYTASASIPSPTPGWTRSYFALPGSASNNIYFQLAYTRATRPMGGPSFVTFDIDQVTKATGIATQGTRRQLIRAIPVSGTMRTQGRLSLQHETSSLGEVLTYTYVDTSGYVPSMRQFYVSGGALTVDASTVSGATNMLDTPLIFRAPATLMPAGGYHLYARLKGDITSSAVLNITAATLINGVAVPGSITFSSTVQLVAGTYGIYDLGPVALPTALLPGNSGGLLQLTLVDADTSGVDITVDETWLFNLDIGQLNHIDCGSAAPAAGGSSKRLYFDPATVTNDGQDAIYRGHSADLSDAFHPADSIKGWTPPIFEPPLMNVFTVTTNALDTAVELRHFPRFLHNVGVVP